MRSGKECKYYELARDNKHDCYCNYFKCDIRNACASCSHYEKMDCMDEDAKQASIPYTYNAPEHDWKCGYPSNNSCWWDGYNTAKKLFERPQGEWIGDTDYESYQGNYEAYKCNKCGYGLHWRDYRTNKYNFCPNCGADMRGEEE